MSLMSQFVLHCSILVLLISMSASAHAQNLYRYKDANGRTVINHAVPPDAAKNGYEVISQSGRVIQTVERQLSGVELEEMSAERQQKRREAEQLEEDKLLLLKYSSVDDIIYAKNRAIQELNANVGILKGNIISLRRKIETLQQNAANIERAGRQVHRSLAQAISDSLIEIQQEQERIDEREKEISEQEALFDADIERYRYITEELGYKR